MFAEITAVRGEKQHRAVQSSQLSFDHTDNKVDLVLAGDLGQAGNSWSRHFHRTVPVAAKILAPLGGSLSQGGAKRCAPGILGVSMRAKSVRGSQSPLFTGIHKKRWRPVLV